MADEELDHEQLADRLQQEADELKQRDQELGSDISDARQEWESKRADPAVPGAAEPRDESIADSDDPSASPPRD